MVQLVGGWDKPEVAQAQRDLVLRELQSIDNIEPYSHFLRAIDTIAKQQFEIINGCTLLDVGCGVGHYGMLCEKYYPRVMYHGTDASEAMIDEARKLAPRGKFDVCQFEDNDFESPDIVMIAQTLEQLGAPWAYLEIPLEAARNFIILHRLRLTEKKSHAISETTYCGNVGRNWLWNLDELVERVRRVDGLRWFYVDKWDGSFQATIIIKKGSK